MKPLLLLITLLFIQQALAQQNSVNNDARVVFRPLVYLDYNFYHWAQEPLVGAVPKNVGQVFNVLPGIGGGFIMGKKTTLMFSIEGAIRYMPFSLDLVENKGMGSLAFPLTANFRIPLEGFFFMQVGGGIQWTSINLHQRTSMQNYPTPFFQTYIGEVAFGIEEHVFLLYFLRFGYHPSQAMSFDFGLRLGLHGDLWN